MYESTGHVGPIKKDGPSVEFVFSLMTHVAECTAFVKTVNHERMPVLLATPEAQDQWMEGLTRKRLRCAGRYPPERVSLAQTGYEKRDFLR